MQPLVHPPRTLTIALKGSDAETVPKSTAPVEVDMTDEDFHELIFYTDGRELKKPTDQSQLQIAAHWDGAKLASDEKSPVGGSMSRIFELSPDGRQLYETLHIDHGKKTPIVIRYVYDATNGDVEPGDSDPNRPVLQRRQDDSSDSSQ